MRSVQQPPDLSEMTLSREKLRLAMKAASELTRYFHWEELRVRQPPYGLTREEWWFGIHLSRQSNRIEVPLMDEGGARFSFIRPDGVDRHLHEIDLRMRVPELTCQSDLVIHSVMEEAILSSQLEGASTTRRVAKEMLESGRQPRDPHERMIYNNYLTMEQIREIKEEPFSPELILELQRIVVEGTLPSPGRFRSADETVVVEDVRSGEVLHRPPPAFQLPKRMEALCDFANELAIEPFIHPVVRAIVIHFWLAFDHPFVDGNGRTARALFYWSLLRSGYDLFQLLSISQILVKAPAKYARAFLFTESDGNDLTYFLLHQLDVIEQTLCNLDSYLETRARKKSALPEELNSRQQALLLHAKSNPGSTYSIKRHQTCHGVAYDTARNDLLSLEARGFLAKKSKGRSFYFVLDK